MAEAPAQEPAEDGATTVWLTGLPASGKSALGELLTRQISARGQDAEFISSGRLRRTPLGASLGFSRDDRDTNVRRHAFAARLLVKHGVAAVVSAVSPYAGTRGEIREQLDRFLLVYVSTPASACVEQDRTGNWARALRGEIRNFTGVDGPYEVPEAPDVDVDLSSVALDVAAARIMAALETRGWVPPESLSEDDQNIARQLGAHGYGD